jgi:hypothetical protein
MQLTTIGLPSLAAMLIYRVKEVPHDLVGDEQPKEVRLAGSRQNAKQRCSVGVASLIGKRADRVFPDLRARDGRRYRSPMAHLTGYGGQRPAQLADYRFCEHAELACV